MADVKVALEDLKEESDSGTLVSPAPMTPGRSKRGWGGWVGAAMALAAAAMTGWYVWSARQVPSLTPVRLATFPGWEVDPAFSPDGKSLYYTKSVRAGPLLRLPPAGGEETQVVGSVFMRAFAVTERGIYFIGARDKQGAPWLQLLETATGRTREIAPINRPLGLGLTVSPDGRTVLYTQEDQAGSDLMLVENFR